METTQKTWGHRTRIFENDLCEVCFLRLHPQRRCSWHHHAAKVNLFYVINGVLFVRTQWGVAEINPGESFTVHPPEKHEFQTHDCGADIIEVAYVKLDPNDIIRAPFQLGGPMPKEDPDG